MNVAALLLPFIVALPPGTSAPPPGTLPAAARVTTLDRELGLVLVRLPKRDAAPALRRLRAAPGVRFVERDAPLQLAAGMDGCATVGKDAQTPDLNWRKTIGLSQRSATGIVIGIADSGVDDDRLAPRQAPLLTIQAGGAPKPQDPLGHGTAVASILIANRPDLGVVGLVPDAALLSARIIKSDTSCGQPVLEHGLIKSLGWLRSQGAQIVNVSATAGGSRALSDSLEALELSGALVVAAAGNNGSKPVPELYPAAQPGVLGVGALAPRSSATVDRDSTRGPQVDLVAPAAGIKVVSSTFISKSGASTFTGRGTSFSAPLVTAAAAMVWATHRDWNAAEVTNALVRSAKPLGSGLRSRSWGYGRLQVSKALNIARMPDPHEPNDWAAAALSQRPLHPGAVVIASIGYAGDTIDAYAVEVPAGKHARAVLREGSRDITLRSLPIGASDALVRGVARSKARPSQVALPPGRSLVVVARSTGAGPYTLALSGS